MLDVFCGSPLICDVFIISAMWPGNATRMPYQEPVIDYKRCYNISANQGELFVTIQLNPLPAYDCINVMDVSVNVSDIVSCSRYEMYTVSALSFMDSVITMSACILTAEESHDLFSYCQYRCEPATNLAFGWSGSSRLQNGMTICDLRWNYEIC